MNITALEQLQRETVLTELNHGLGFVLAGLTNEDMALLRNLVRDQYLHVIQMMCPQRVGQYCAAPMSDYHHIFQADDFDHGAVWQKSARVLGPAAVAQIEQSNLYQQLRRLYGDILISDEEQFGWPGMYWRLVRPNQPDVGPLHADKWFWDLGHGEMPQGYHRVKLWLALYSEPGSSGLRVVPESHRRDDWRYHGEWKGDKMKPVIDEVDSDLDILHLPLHNGQCVMFHDGLLHGGILNQSEHTRVSLEFTLFVPNTTIA